RIVLYALTALVAVVGAVSVALVVHLAHHLPVLINGQNTLGLAVLTAPVALPMVALTLWDTWRGTRGREGPERWIIVTALVCLCDLVLTYVAHYRYSLGWYAGRVMTLLGAALVMITMHSEFRRLKAMAELHAATDQLTGLANRRTFLTTLSAVVARAARVAGTTSVLMLDLDGFKAINDRHGHDAGDRLLQAAAASWSSQLRAGDLLARTGGDEFLAVLADTDEIAARILITRLLDATPAAISVSIGLAVAQGDHDIPMLIAAADHEMYITKAMRRDLTASPRSLSDRRSIGDVAAFDPPGVSQRATGP
ncbi:MAG: GGDEF domain-containing protein, partial [Actinomycetota bacterium]|nr:GGDEF domain-containing protein [Actinomycetota bacterium]